MFHEEYVEVWPRRTVVTTLSHVQLIVPWDQLLKNASRLPYRELSHATSPAIRDGPENLTAHFPPGSPRAAYVFLSCSRKKKPPLRMQNIVVYHKNPTLGNYSLAGDVFDCEIPQEKMSRTNN